MKKQIKKRKRIFLLILLITALIFSAYQFLLRPVLKKSMATEVLSIGITFILLAVLIIAILMTFSLCLYMTILKYQGIKNLRLWKVYRRYSVFALVIVLILLGGLTYYSQENAYLKPLCNEYNDVIPTSISSIEKVKLNENDQWISIRGKNKDNPVLLILSDGPGKSEMAAFNKSLESLQEDFVVINWDQLGSGKSYKNVEGLNISNYVSDGVQLSRYLCERFKKEKIYLLGNSFGSTLGMLMVKESPDLYNGFIGTSQLVSIKRNEEYRYKKAYEIAEKKEDKNELRKLKAQGTPSYEKNMYKKQKVYYNYLVRKENENTKISGDGENTSKSIFSSEYGLLDKVNMIKAQKNTYDKVFKSYYDIDLIKNVSEVSVPVYFFQGKYDELASQDLLNEYFSNLNAPDKQIIWFEKSGSRPWISEKNEFVNNVKRKFLNK